MYPRNMLYVTKSRAFIPASALENLDNCRMGNDSPLSETAVEVGGVKGVTGKRVWHRRVFFQATIVGLCAFLAPGLYNAMQSTGAGGQQTPYLVM